jgi:cobalt-zinc-cadmium efflux system protein
MPAISAHMLVGEDVDCHQARWRAARLLADRFGVEHTTLQVEHEPGDELLEIQPARETEAAPEAKPRSRR